MSEPIVVSLFSGAGGLDFGFEAAGFTIGAAVESDRDCCRTLRNRLDERVIERDIFDVQSSEILTVAGTSNGDVDALIGGPPCQPFSKSGFWRTGDTGRLADPRAATLDAYLRVLEETAPKVMFLENVAGLGYEGKSDGLDLLLKRIESINDRIGTAYMPSYAVVDARSYGVPQRRQRFIIVASRDGTRFRFPSPTHGDVEVCEDESLVPFATAFDAIGHLELEHGEDLTIRGKWADLIPSIPEGMNYLHHTSRGEGMPLFGWRRRYWNFLLKLSKRLPAWTIQAQPGPSVGPFHWSNRRLSIQELSALQTFPSDLRIVGGRTSAQRQLGNAVPSLLGEVFARAIRTDLLGQPPTSRRPKLLPSRAEEIPPPEPVARVPAKYHHLAGEHSPHPGTGLGVGAMARRANA